MQVMFLGSSMRLKKKKKQKFRVAKGLEMQSEEIHFLANCSLANVPCL